MKIQKIEIEDKLYTIQVAETEEEFDKGLMNIDGIPKDEGMLFPFDEEEEQTFWMKDTRIPLDIIFIDSDGFVNSVFLGEPYSEEIISGIAKYVLELNADSGVTEGDFIDLYPDEEESKEGKMYVISMEGKPIMELEGGERIFSRKNTRTLIKFAKKAHKSNKDSDYKALGKRLFKFLDTQESNEPQYVEE